MDEPHHYFDYLTSRSMLGQLYRQRFLYPRMSRYLTGRVLDVGCGIGDMVSYRPETSGVDINAECVRYCVERGLDVQQMQEDRLPFADASFDGVLLDNVLEHIAEPAPLLAEVRRVLVPRGTFLVAVPGKRGFASDTDHKIFYTQRALVDRLSVAGFVHLHTLHTPFRFPGLQYIVRFHALLGVFNRAD